MKSSYLSRHLSKIAEPSEEFTVLSEWNSRWIPEWYHQDQPLVVGEQQEFLFCEDVPGWMIRYMARHRIDCPALVFYEPSSWNTRARFIVLVCEILEIHNKHWGAINSVQVSSCHFDIRLKSGQSLIVNTEEYPGAIWDETTQEWSQATQDDDWSMSVKLRIVDRDPQKIFGRTAAPKPFCTEPSSPDVAGDALYEAANVGDVDKVRQLIDQDIDVNRKMRLGDTALFRAARHGSIEIVLMLLGVGAKPNLQSRTGWAPLHTASSQGHTEIVKTLLAAGAHVDIRNNTGWTPLFMAAGSGQEESVRALLEAGADFYAEDANGNTPLLNAQKNGYQDVAHLLKLAEEKENGH